MKKEKCNICGNYVKGNIYNICFSEGKITIYYDNDYKYDDWDNPKQFLICNKHKYNICNGDIIHIPDHIPKEQHNKFFSIIIKRRKLNDKTTNRYIRMFKGFN